MPTIVKTWLWGPLHTRGRENVPVDPLAYSIPNYLSYGCHWLGETVDLTAFVTSTIPCRRVFFSGTTLLENATLGRSNNPHVA